MRRTSVCKDCEDRKVGCHSTCRKYIEQSEQYKKENAEIYKQRSIDGLQKKRAVESAIRMKKRRKH